MGDDAMTSGKVNVYRQSGERITRFEGLSRLRRGEGSL